MLHRTCFLVLFISFSAAVFAQPYTQAQYAVAVEKNITYGVDKTFAGQDFELKLDIYKPLNNTDVARPIYIHVHGGSWLEISNKDAAESAAVCTEMAKKGYVAANIEYRRGYHRTNFYNPYALCSAVVLPNQSDCIYVQDSSEIVRAIYRGMQDAKAAIRFMKSRHTLDSTNMNAVCIGGESAGGFIALYTGFLTCPEEKPTVCYALPDALPADSDLADCNPATVSLARPDLGSIQGTVNINGFTDEVVGVANFFGGIMHPILAGPKPPAVYLFHQTNDVIVDCNYKRPLQSLYELVIYPLNLCQPLTPFPKAWGSCSIKTQLNDLGLDAPAFDAQIVNNGAPNALANPPGHAYDNISLRVSQAAALFSPYVSGQIQAPAGTPCNATGVKNSENLGNLTVAPNPGNGHFNLSLPDWAIGTADIVLVDIHGRIVAQQNTVSTDGSTISLDYTHLPPGVYRVSVQASGQWICGKILIQRA